MTEEQRVKLEELIWEFEQVVLLAYEHSNKEYSRSEREKARDRITNHLDTIPNLLDKKGRLSRVTEGLMRKNRG